MCPAMATAPDIPIEDLPAQIASGQRLLGLDLGTKTIGLALSDVNRGIATPLQTIRRTKFTKDAELLLAVCADHDIAGFVIGLPVNMNGTEGPRAQATRAFARSLKGKTELPIVFWDERLSTVAAERVMIAADVSRKKRAQKIDAAAAGIILQGALDRLAVLERSRP